MSAILNREPGTSAQSEENQVSTSTTTQQNVFTVQQIQPQAIFAGAHIDKFEGCTFNINVFCGDQSKIARLNQNWSLEAQTGITYIAVALLVTFHKLLFQPQAFSLSLYEKFCLHSLTKFVQSWTLNSYFCPVWTGNQWQKKASLNAWARAGKQIKLFTFLFLCFLVWPYNKHIINRARAVCMEESSPRSLVQTSLRSFCTGDLGQDSPIQTSRSVNKS